MGRRFRGNCLGCERGHKKLLLLWSINALDACFSGTFCYLNWKSKYFLWCNTLEQCNYYNIWPYLRLSRESLPSKISESKWQTNLESRLQLFLGVVLVGQRRRRRRRSNGRLSAAAAARRRRSSGCWPLAQLARFAALAQLAKFEVRTCNLGASKCPKQSH